MKSETTGGDEMEREQRFKKIKAHLASGGSIIISTHLKAWKLSRKHADLLTFNGHSLYLQHGKRNDCIDYCAISFSR